MSASGTSRTVMEFYSLVLAKRQWVRTREQFDPAEAGIHYYPLDKTSFTVLGIRNVEEIFMCLYCHQEVKYTFCVGVDGTTTWGQFGEGGGRYLMPMNGGMEVPIRCPTDGYLGPRLCVIAALVSNLSKILAPLYHGLTELGRTSIFYSGRGHLVFRLRCCGGNTFAVIIHNAVCAPTLRYPWLRYPGSSEVPVVLQMYCPGDKSDLIYQKYIFCERHQFQHMLEVRIARSKSLDFIWKQRYLVVDAMPESRGAILPWMSSAEDEDKEPSTSEN